MSYMHPALAEHLCRRWERADAYRFAAPGTPEAKMPGTLHPWAAVARAEEAKAAADAKAHAEFKAEVEALRADHERVRGMLADVKFELALRRVFHKYSPDQPRVPAGSREGGQWTSGGGGSDGHSSEIGRARDPQRSEDRAGQRDGRIRVAGDPPVLLQRIHPDATYESDPDAKRSLNYWRGKSTEDIVESLRSGNKDSLTTFPDGRIKDGNTRIKILQERGYDVNSLPREIYRPEPMDPLGSRSGGRSGGGGLGGVPGLKPWQRLFPWQ